ncbi:putative nepenthesin [Rosa chinensis]|uniref:Putative nepenthesin n=1 Tax=Rosa chinensis TaxID=74649 RepID=A0A2P6PW24_ROSCH|nr:probable aspartic proteinase GIP2 [Rosa chinensis]PRQ26137.1 putative nepenthesin [Rosa chinensis]
MASSVQFCALFSTLLLIFTSATFAQQSFRPKALVVPVTKDASTLQYTTRIAQRTPLVPISLVLDLGGQFLWVDCEQNYVSSTYRPARCRSAQCSLAGASGCGDCFSSPKPGCNNNTCGVTPDNTVTRTATGGELAQDVVSVQSTTGSNPGQNVTVSNFLFACAPTSLLSGLAAGVSGMAGLGRTKIALSSQFASAFSFKRKFAVCLSSSTSANGVAFFGDGPYSLLPGIDVSQSLTYSPLFINPVSTASAFSQGDASSEYFIGVNSIKVNDKAVDINTTLLSINNSSGVGGTKISTVNPYTVLEASIFKAVTEAFVTESAARNISRVAAVAPFEVCFSTENVLSTRLGPSVPEIDLVLQNESTYWRMFGANSMVYVSDDILCLGFVNGGENAMTSIVIGGHQLEDNLVQFDLAASRVGFSSTLLGRQTTCSNFNFTSVA